MTDTYNAIWIGYPFSQDFETDPGAVPDGATLWLDLHSGGTHRQLLLSHVVFTRVSSTLFRLQLTGAQTAAFPEGQAVGDIVQMLSSVDAPLALRLTIPVMQSLSEPA